MAKRKLDPDKLRDARENAVFTVKKLASLITFNGVAIDHLSESAIREYEKGTREPTQEVLEKIAEVLDVHVDDLLLLDDRLEVIAPDGTTRAISHNAFKKFQFADYIVGAFSDFPDSLQQLMPDKSYNSVKDYQRCRADQFRDFFKAYQIFNKYVYQECDVYWNIRAQRIKNKMADKEDEAVTADKERKTKNAQNAVYKYTLRSKCKKADFERALEFLQGLIDWMEHKGEKWQKIMKNPKYDLKWISDFSPKICKITEVIISEIKLADDELAALKNVIKFFEGFPKLYENFLNEIDNAIIEGDIFKPEERKRKIRQEIKPEWDAMPPQKQFVVSSILFYDIKCQYGNQAYGLMEQYKELSPETKSLICAWIICRADDEMKKEIYKQQSLFNEYAKADFADCWNCLLETLEFNDLAFLQFDAVKYTDAEDFDFFLHIFVYLILEAGKFENLRPTLDILLEGKQLLDVCQNG